MLPSLFLVKRPEMATLLEAEYFGGSLDDPEMLVKDLGGRIGGMWRWIEFER